MALNAYQTLVNQTAAKRALSGEEQERLRQIAAQQGAAAASSAYLANQNAQQTAMPDYVAASKAKSAANQAIVNGATAGQSVQTQNAYQKALANAQPSVNVPVVERNTYSGDAVSPAAQATLGTPQPAASQPVVQSRDYLIFGNPAEGFKSGMSAEDQASWNAIGQKYAAGDTSWNRDTNQFREDGNWGSFYDDNGNINGWLYAGDGLGGYAPAFGGKIGESGYKAGTIFYSPDGKAYTMGADGTLTQSGNVEWAKYGSYVGPKAGYQDSPFWALEDGQYKRYTNQTAPDSVLEAQGYYRDANGLVMPINDQYRISQAVKNGDITPEQAALAQATRNGNPGNMPSAPANVPSNTPSSTTGGGGSYFGSSSQTTPTQAQPIQNQPVQNQPVQTQPTQAYPNIYQQYMDQWDYPEAPQWEGSEYQQKRDDALKRAEDMRWNYDPNTDPVWQALQKQYRREGDRATQEAMAQAAMRTGGLANSYAATAASQAGDYYAAQLSDRLPQLYQDAYNRYLQEFQRQMGISDQYQGFDDREYSRFGDRLQQYNTDRNFDYGRYRDAVGDVRYDDETQYGRNYQAQRDAILDNRADREWAQQLREYADAQNWKATEWEQYLREYGDQLSEKERQWAYQMARDAVEDNRWERQYADQRSDTMYERALYDQEYADQRGDIAWEQGYKQTAYNDEMERTALNYLNTNGIVTGRYAEILGVPDGTTYEQYYSRYLGGGNSSPFEETEIPSGTTPTDTPLPDDNPPGDTPPGDTPPGDTPPDDTGNGRTWWNGRPMTDTAYDLQSRIAYGWAQKTLTKENVQRMVYDAARKGYIEDYEIPLLMRIIGVNIQGPPQQNPNVEGPIAQWTK